MKKALVNYSQYNNFMWNQTCSHNIEICFLGKKFKNNDWWSTDVTLTSITVNSAPACNYIQIA